MSIKRSIVLRVRIAFLVVVLFALAVIFRIGKIQFVDGAKWKAKAETIGLQYRVVKATRGNIYSDNGSLMATSLPFFRLGFDPTVASDEIFSAGIDSLALLLSQKFGDNSKEYYKRKIKDARTSNKRYIRLAKQQINYNEKKEIAQWPIIREGRYRGGIVFEKIDKRFKPFGQLASRTIGFLNEDMNGAGLEYSFNPQLGGKDGKALFQKISGGNWKPVVTSDDIKSSAGLDVQTTIDINLQDVAENSLLKALEDHEANYGCVVLMEVQTGEIKAIANLGRTESGKYYETYNYAVGNQGLTDPGSTFKLASMIALFEEKNISLTDTVNTGNGRYKYYKSTMTDAHEGGYGTLTVQQAFEKSSNIGVSKLVTKHFKSNPQRFIDYMYDMKIDKPIGFQITGEAVPYIKNTKDDSWSGISLPWMSIGYEMALAPIQTLTLYNAVANQGKMIQPVIIKEARMADKIIEQYQTKVLNQKICSDKTLAKLHTMLEGVVQNGTAKNIKCKEYSIAGKTGTAQKIKNGKYVRQYYTSFVGYFPAEKPKYSCIVVVDDPQGWRREGSNVAAPVFREISDKVYARDLSLHPPITLGDRKPGIFPVIKGGFLADLRDVCNELSISNHPATEEEWVKTQIRNNAVHWKPKGIEEALVPDVSGYTLKDALFLLENAGMQVEFKGQGRVVAQSQSPGTKVLTGSTIAIKLEI